MTNFTKQPDQTIGFRFPIEHRFTPDRIATEYRILLKGYLAQAHMLLDRDPKVQEFRDCITRISELTSGMVAHELGNHLKEKSALPDHVLEQRGESELTGDQPAQEQQEPEA